MLKGTLATFLAVAVFACSGTTAEAQNPIASKFNHLNRNLFGGANCGRDISNAQAASLWGNYCNDDCTIYSGLSGQGGGGGGFGGCLTGACGAAPVSYAPSYGSSCGGASYGGSSFGGLNYAYGSTFGDSSCGVPSYGVAPQSGCKIKRLIAHVFRGCHGGGGGGGCCGGGCFGYGGGGGCGGCGSSYLGYGGGGGGCGLHGRKWGGGGCGLHGRKCGGGSCGTSYGGGYASTGYAGYASTGYAGYSSACGGGKRCCLSKLCGHGGRCRLFSGGGIHDRMFSSFYVANTGPTYFANYVGGETGFSDFSSSVDGSITGACGCSSCGGGGGSVVPTQSYYAPQPTAGGYSNPAAGGYLSPTVATPTLPGY